jgi:HAD superfamily hydrolase (TIGR01509 family)
MNRIKAVLLDVDGTLLDSNDAHAHSWVDAFAAFGIETAFGQVRPLIGMGGDHLLAHFGVEKDSDRARALTTVRGQIFRDYYLPALRPFPFVRELLERMKSDGMRLVVVTSSTREDLKPLLERAGITDLMDEEVCSNDARHSKPDPDIVHAALARLDASPDEVVMVGDTPYDVKAAVRAKVGVIAVRSGGWADAELSGALAIYDDARDLLAHYGAPFVARRKPRAA